jgi:hypothetical protein
MNLIKSILSLIPILGLTEDPLGFDGGSGGVDPLGLDIDTNDVDTNYPVLLEGKYPVRIKTAVVEPNKDKTGRNLKVQFETLSKHTSLAGKAAGKEDDANAGLVLTRYYALQPSQKNASWDWKVDPIKLCDAAHGTKQGTRKPLGQMIAQLAGKEVVLGVKVRKGETDMDPPQNDIAGVYPKKAEEVA